PAEDEAGHLEFHGNVFPVLASLRRITRLRNAGLGALVQHDVLALLAEANAGDGHGLAFPGEAFRLHQVRETEAGNERPWLVALKVHSDPPQPGVLSESLGDTRDRE